ncbi:hypothetical protein NF700_10255 [Sphingomonadaceae bacterium OTU29MARTA1]|uniref:hypothetical protein n=1 Tax=Sphingomonas sp. Leaf37 TaxID=2876552 RepID=UPI001E33EE77|nr:hypothetical protein [Sphingomonas sp. Leaf37]USU03741.1 hypothetical protein NF699_11710 [Sphingomonadaceae bacterium OTU29LAMAA1]USU07492.1 hypothetical protein NF700_10255 [Sphingomonadaceae bacterium OTU29MARTA1]USU10984.1 hypothetical protein NF701_10440 [Sphingomonadaceae bacterium OTU29THOMA1]
MRTIVATALMLVASPALAQQAAQVTPTPALPGASRPTVINTPGEVAKRAPVNGVLVLYGNERCPTNTDGDEIVVCERRSAREQYRVPKELRDFQVTPQNESWAARAQGTLDTGVGVSTLGSCSAVGAAGQTGCFVQNARAVRKENQARKVEEARVP